MLKHIGVGAISLLCIFIADASFAQSVNSKIVYIDPVLYEPAPLPIRSKADKFAREFAKRVKDNLVEQRTAAYVAGGNGAASSLEERLNEAQEREAVVYVAISVTASKKSCVNILHPKFEKKKYTMTQKPDAVVPEELANSIANADREGLINESQKISTLMQQKISGNVVNICCRTSAGYNFLLRISSIPTLIVDFELNDIKNQSPFPKGETINRIARAISDAISIYLSTPGDASIKIE